MSGTLDIHMPKNEIEISQIWTQMDYNLNVRNIRPGTAELSGENIESTYLRIKGN